MVMTKKAFGIFKAYDIRGIYPAEINEELVYRIGHAYAKFVKPQTVAVGRDVRKSGAKLFKALTKGLTEAGVDVIDIGVITTDMLYFAVGHYGYDGGITISASHNPAEYNGLKMVKRGPEAISGDSGIYEIRDMALSDGKFPKSHVLGTVEKKDILADYISEILQFVDTAKLKHFKIAVNPNFGAAVPVLEALAKQLPLELVKLNFKIDGSFPKGRPDPLIPENRSEMAALVASSGVDFGVAWDADADRCFFFDEKGQFVDPYHMVGVLAKIILKKYPGGKIIYDPRLTWATLDQVSQAGGVPTICRAGHSFIKEKMRREDAAFGGENSAHYYFKDFYYSDNGMIPFLMILAELSESGQKLSDLFVEIRQKYPNSGELNYKVSDVNAKIDQIRGEYHDGEMSEIDGLSVEYPTWRFNLRVSNTEPLLRLNVEAKNTTTLKKETGKLVQLIEK